LLDDNIKIHWVLTFLRILWVLCSRSPPSCISPNKVSSFVNNRCKQIVAKFQFWTLGMTMIRFVQQGLFGGLYNELLTRKEHVLSFSCLVTLFWSPRT
jgi:hypothetical protein